LNDPASDSTPTWPKADSASVSPSPASAQRFTDRSFGIVPVTPPPEIETPETPQTEPQFLLIQHQAGHWGFPKGHAEANETPVAAACREFEEETGIRAYRLLDETAFSESYRFTKKQKLIEKTVIYYVALVETKQVTIQADEVRDFAWLTYSEALNRITFAQSHVLLTQVKAHLTDHL
jgi:bis(5'-nucleosidyl)-tetraphosphatase